MTKNGPLLIAIPHLEACYLPGSRFLLYGSLCWQFFSFLICLELYNPWSCLANVPFTISSPSYTIMQSTRISTTSYSGRISWCSSDTLLDLPTFHSEEFFILQISIKFGPACCQIITYCLKLYISGKQDSVWTYFFLCLAGDKEHHSSSLGTIWFIHIHGWHIYLPTLWFYNSSFGEEEKDMLVNHRTTQHSCKTCKYNTGNILPNKV